jgi:hypothetical protein
MEKNWQPIILDELAVPKKRAYTPVPVSPKRKFYSELTEEEKKYAYRFNDRLKKYKLNAKKYIALKEFQEYSCYICGNTERLNIDHDHSCCLTTPTCGECTRGLLCRSCNYGLGHFKDNPSLLAKALEYLENPPINKLK